MFILVKQQSRDAMQHVSTLSPIYEPKMRCSRLQRIHAINLKIPIQINNAYMLFILMTIFRSRWLPFVVMPGRCPVPGKKRKKVPGFAS